MIKFDDFTKPAKIFAAIYGYGGGGKSFTAYQMATQLAPDGVFPIIDTEHGSSKKYLNSFPGMRPIVIEDFSVETYKRAIDLALTIDPTVIVIDSISPEWAGTGGVLDTVSEIESRKGASFANWKVPKRDHAALFDYLDKLPQHIILTIRAKDKTVPTKNSEGKVEMVKVTAAMIQDKEIGFLPDIIIRSEKSGKRQIVTKSRAHGFIAEGDEMKFGILSNSGVPVVDLLQEWLESQKRNG
jgi:hypothetical protein